MGRARGLAERGRYTVAPNPLVGAVVARGDDIVGEGWHVRAGGEHAEVAALRAAGAASSGATMHVTLEPCNHHGRTPPCTDAIIRAGVCKVVVGHLDPDPRMRGRSVALLREAGVEVEVLDDPSFALQNEQFVRFMQSGRPFVHLKLAATLDGRIAAASGDSRWVTGETARRRAHALRAEAGAVLVGAGTARADDPLLRARDLPEMPPPITRVVIDPGLTLSLGSRLARTAREDPVLIFADTEASDGREKELGRRGVEVVAAPRSVEGLDVAFILKELGRRGIRGVLVEGGGETAGRFVSSGLVDKMTLFYAPKLVGCEGTPMIGKLRLAQMAQAMPYEISSAEAFGEDLALTLYPARR
jgi:diaminohydroxyphosphoribosylaminopyrimidine deaminase / 5-amino-6-(5-phosphoribosylamino)uracil reductase